MQCTYVWCEDVHVETVLADVGRRVVGDVETYLIEVLGAGRPEVRGVPVHPAPPRLLSSLKGASVRVKIDKLNLKRTLKLFYVLSRITIISTFPRLMELFVVDSKLELVTKEQI